MPNLLPELKEVLQNVPADRFERLVGRLLSRLLDVPFRRARSGDQFGGDGGVQGPAGRDLIFEARRYKDTSLNERDIEGQIQQAIRRNPDLEAWILVTTREVPEQVRTAMVAASQSAGIAAIIVDWLPQPLPGLAALCAFAPEDFESEVGGGHLEVLTNIENLPEYQATLESLRAELRGWAIGYETLRESSHRWLFSTWESRDLARSRFGQMVAGGATGVHHVRRSAGIASIDEWWDRDGPPEPAVVFGREGMGKTWVALDWLQLAHKSLPIVVAVPSTALADIRIATPGDLIEFIAKRLSEQHQFTSWRPSFWERRVERLLARPVDESPAFILYVDGLNQVPNYDWIQALCQLLEEGLRGKVRLLLSARKAYLEESLGRLDAAFGGICRIEVGPYDLAPGGEFDKRLESEGMSRADVPDQLIKLASVPRLFDLVVRLRDELGDARDVTVQRLLWAYGANAIQELTDGAFDERGWRRFLLDLAREYCQARDQLTIQDVAALAADSRLTPDTIHRRTSSVIDSIFGVLSTDGEVGFAPEFVHHCLGLALAKQAGEAGGDVENALTQFLDPIEGFDERAEILGAAVTIAMQPSAGNSPEVLDALCTSWVQTQNIGEQHVEELRVLAPGLVEPLLSAVERSVGHSLRRARYIGINALVPVDNESPDVAAAIANRAAEWLRAISLEGHWGTDGAQRRKTLAERVGVDDVGRLTVAGHEFVIVEAADNDLPVVAAQLMQGRPLCGAGEYFELAAARGAITRESQLEQPWLNVVNALDPEQTAVELRSRADRLRRLAEEPEKGIDAEVYKRMAALLLYWTGYEDDVEKARLINPEEEAWQQHYQTDYLKNPGLSWMTLERRHAAQVLRDDAIHVSHRIQRAKNALLDPEFEVPPEFANSIVSATAGYSFDEADLGRSRSLADIDWEELSLGLARCAPRALAALERARLRSYAGRKEDERYGAALATPGLMLLATPKECAAAQALRKNVSAKPDGSQEHWSTTYLLTLEIQCEPPAKQIIKILESGLDWIHRSLAAACSTPSTADVDQLVARYRNDPSRLDALAAALAPHDVALSPAAFNTFLGLRGEQGEPFHAWVLLGTKAPHELGEVLVGKGWAWSACKPYIENVTGSLAVAEASRGTPFLEYAHRIAPARLLRALSLEERQKLEVEFAVEQIRLVLSRDVNAPEPGIEVTHSREQGGAMENYLCSIGDVLEQETQGNLHASIRRSREGYEERRNTLGKQYVEEVEKARRAGAHLLLVDFDPEDFNIVLDHCPEGVELWLEGMDSVSEEFIRRVHLATGFFVVLCEALLKRGHPRSLALWSALRRSLTHVSFKVHGDMDRLIHALWAAPPSVEIDKALESTIQEAATDWDLMELVVAARQGGREDWLAAKLSRDSLSPCPADRRRSSFLAPLVSRPGVGSAEEWPEGGRPSTEEAAWMLGQREAFAAAWLRRFVEADSAEDAHAAWHLFCASADRRTWSWLDEELNSLLSSKANLDNAKQRLRIVDRHRLERAIKANGKSWKETYANAKYPKALRPWCWQ